MLKVNEIFLFYILLIKIFSLGEAAHLARDFHYVCDQEFPARHCAEYNNRQYNTTHHLQEPNGITKRKQNILAAK